MVDLENGESYYNDEDDDDDDEEEDDIVQLVDGFVVKLLL